MSELNWVDRLPTHENQRFLKSEIITEAAGYFSRCWDKDGVFESEKAVVACHNLSSYLAADMPSNVDVAMAVQVLVKALEEDEEYRQTWVANIAMAFKDEHSRNIEHGENPDVHTIANAAAENFLSLLCMNSTA